MSILAQCHGAKLIYIFRAQQDRLFQDLTLKAPDKAIRVHKIIVCPPSAFLTKKTAKTPKKGEISVDVPGAILSGIVKYLYCGSYAVPKSYKPLWDLKDDCDDDSALKVEYHFKMLQAATTLGIPKLEALAGKNLKAQLQDGPYSDSLYAKLQEVPKKTEMPFAVAEAIIDSQARKVKQAVEEGGEDINSAFHKAGRVVASRYLADYIQAVGNALGKQFRLYLRCPNCACVIRGKEDNSNDFVCIREDCGVKKSLGQLLLDERLSHPAI